MVQLGNDSEWFPPFSAGVACVEMSLSMHSSGLVLARVFTGSACASSAVTVGVLEYPESQQLALSLLWTEESID